MGYTILRYFKYDHLPPNLQDTSRHFHKLAHLMAQGCGECEEVEAGLRKLLEAKDCFVRAQVTETKADEPDF